MTRLDTGVGLSVVTSAARHIRVRIFRRAVHANWVFVTIGEVACRILAGLGHTGAGSKLANIFTRGSAASVSRELAIAITVVREDGVALGVTERWPCRIGA
jgi:hypothetical protein